MKSSILEHECLATKIVFSSNAFTISLNDGRNVTIPLTWYPRLLAGNSHERNIHVFIGKGEGIHWPVLDEDIRVEDLLLGRRSGESQTSLKKWLEKRKSK